MRRRSLWILALLVLVGSSPATAQWPPERFENLQVLPDTIPRQELVALMAGFTRALGVRCTYCHVGEEGRPLSTYDFPSDEKLTKRKAREMLRMVAAINGEHLHSLEERAEPPVRVRCVTCHGGRTTPRQLEEELLLAYDGGGLDSAVTSYRNLRDHYYGQAAYDFGSVPLTVLADSINTRGSLQDAVAVLELNVEMNPTSVFAKRQHGFAAVLQTFVDEGVDAGRARFRALRDEYGREGFPEFALNRIGYALLARDQPAEALVAFTLTVEEFPESANAYDSLGEGYAAVGDTTGAIASYERSLELNPQNENARAKLRELRGNR